MSKSVAIEGTKHTISLDRSEALILDAIRRTEGVRKLKPNRVEHTGPSPLRLEIRKTEFCWLVCGQLFIGSGKRYCHIYIDQETELGTLQRNLSAALSRSGIEVVMQGGVQMHVSDNGIVQNGLSAEEQWVECLVIYEQVCEFKKIEDQEVELELQLEDIRKRKVETRDKALAARRGLNEFRF
jgi:hypothetical protein